MIIRDIFASIRQLISQKLPIIVNEEYGIVYERIGKIALPIIIHNPSQIAIRVDVNAFGYMKPKIIKEAEKIIGNISHCDNATHIKPNQYASGSFRDRLETLLDLENPDIIELGGQFFVPTIATFDWDEDTTDMIAFKRVLFELK